METETEVIMILNNGHACPQALLNSVKKEMLSIVSAVPQEALLTTPQLCGPDYWDPLSKWEKTLAGSCMDHLVEHNCVPFELVPRTGRNPYPLQFRIKASYIQNH